MAKGDGRRERRHRFLIGLTVLAAVLGATTTAVSIFHVGVSTGLALAGGGFVVYAVPAAHFGWPLPSLHDVLSFFADLVGSVVSGIVDFIRSLFD